MRYEQLLPWNLGGGRSSRRGGRCAALICALLVSGLAGVAGGQAVTEFPIPTADSFPASIEAGPDGNLWFTELGGKIGRITTAGVVTEYPIPTADSGTHRIAAGLDGNLWFTELDANKIGRITTAGVVTEFPVPTVSSEPLGIAPGPDGNLWFTEGRGNQIGRITTPPCVVSDTTPCRGQVIRSEPRSRTPITLDTRPQ